MQTVSLGVCVSPRSMLRLILLFLLLALLTVACDAAAQAEKAASDPGVSAEITLVIRNVRAVTWVPIPGSVWPRAEITPELVDIAVAGDRIAAIATGLAERYPKARLVDGHGGYAIPGLIDVHVHAGSGELGPNAWPLFVDMFTRGRIKGAHALDAGVTTLRSAGDAFPGIDAMHRLWESNPSTMPRLEFVGPMFTAPGGHPVSTVFRGSPWLSGSNAREVTSADEAASEARKVLHSAPPAPTTLKAIYTTLEGHLPRLSKQALQGLVREAAAAGAVVIAHTDSVEDLMDAVEAGVWGVEHGVTSGERLSPEQAGRLAEAGVFYSPTLAVIEQVYPDVLPAALENVRTVYAAGVPIVTGTDAGNPGVLYGLSVLREVELLHEAGLSAPDALAAATYQAARYLRTSKPLGSLAPGFGADIVVVARNPLEDLSALREVRQVVRSGRVARLDGAGRVDGRWRFEPFLGLDALVVGGSLARRTDGPVKVRADAGYAITGSRAAYRLRVDLGRSQATAAYVQAGDWPGSPVLGRRGQQGLTGGMVLAQSLAFKLEADAGFVRLWELSGDPAPPSAAYGRAQLSYRWLFDERRMGATSLEAVVGATDHDTTFASLVLATSVELGELRTRLKAGVSETRGPGLQGFAFSLGGPYGPATLRGYPEGSLSGNRMVGLTADYRWLPSPNLPYELHVFADAAAAWPPSAPAEEPLWGLSAGVGAGMSLGPSGGYRLDVVATRSGQVVPVFWFQGSF